MANNNALSQVGAIPGIVPGKSSLTVGGSPRQVATALSPGQFGGATRPPVSSTPTPPGRVTSGVINLGHGSPTDNVALGNRPGLIKPTTPVKKTTFTNADGSSVTQEHHPEPKTNTSTVSNQNNAPVHDMASSDEDIQAKLKANTARNNLANFGSAQGVTPVNLGTQIPNVLDSGQQTGNETQMQQNVLQAGQTTPDEKAFQDQYVKSVAGKQFGQLAPYAEASMYAGKTPEQLQGLITAPDLAGRASADTGLYNQLGTAYGNAALAGLSAAQVSAARNLTATQNAYSGAQTQAGRNLTAQSGVLGAVSPTMQFGQLTSPVTGNPISGGDYTNNPQLQSAIQQAVQLVQSGTAPNDPAVQSLLSTFGLPGQQAFTTAMQQVNNGTYNPTAQNVSATTNATIGSKYQNQAADLSTSLAQFNNVASTATNFLTSNLGLNPTDIPKINDQIGTYMHNIKNPAAIAQYNLIMNDTTALQGSILNSYGGTTPTANVKATLETDPTTLPVNQLQSWFSTLKQLGDIQLNAQQNTSHSAYNSSGTYSGTPTTANTSTATTPNTTTQGINTGTLGEAAGGLGINAGGGLLNIVKNVGGEILGFIGSHVLGL